MGELKPCPFCGKPAELIASKHIPTGIDYTPRCTDTSCPGRCTKKYALKETAISKWNDCRQGSKEQKFDRETALLVLKEISKRMHPTYDLYGTPTLEIYRDRFEVVRKMFLDRRDSHEMQKL